MQTNNFTVMGPIQYPGMTVVLDQNGIQATEFDFALKEAPVLSNSNWITPDKNYFPEVKNLALFRKELELAGEPERVIAQISADPAFRLYINGQLCSRGPDDIGSDIPVVENDKYSISTKNWLYIQRDLTLFFRQGKNIIAVEVLNYCHMGANLTSGALGFWFSADITQSQGKKIEVVTDDSWTAATADYFSFAGRSITYSADDEPVGWRTTATPSFDWYPAKILPDRQMSISQIPPCMEVAYPWQEVCKSSQGVEVIGSSLIFEQDGLAVLKLDRVIPVYLGVVVKGTKDAELEFRMEELPGNSNWHAKCVLRDGIHELELPSYGSCAYLEIEAKNISKKIEIEELRLVFTSYPVAYQGSFECNDAELNRKWDASRHALQICLQTHHLDSPHHQEPISDPGDYLIEALINYYCFGYPWLVRQDIRKFAQVLETVNYRNFHTSYSLLWLQMLMDYYDFNNDGKTVIDVAAFAHKLLDTFASWIGKNGLVCNAPSYMFLDWVDIAGFSGHHPPPVIGMGYMSAFYYQALGNGVRIAEMGGNAPLAEKYRDLRISLKAAFNTVLWDDQEGLYRDGVPFVSEVPSSDPWLPADEDIETHTPHVNTLAVLCDLAPADRKAPIMEKVMQIKEPAPQPYFMHFVFAALEEAGLFEKYALKLFQRWEIIPETGTFYEMWGRGDLSHAWNGTILYQMSSKILGVTPLEPGFAKFAVSPQPCGLKFAKGKIPTPHGIIEVEWENKDGKVKISKLEYPEGCEPVIKEEYKEFVRSA